MKPWKRRRKLRNPANPSQPVICAPGKDLVHGPAWAEEETLVERAKRDREKVEIAARLRKETLAAGVLDRETLADGKREHAPIPLAAAEEQELAVHENRPVYPLVDLRQLFHAKKLLRLRQGNRKNQLNHGAVAYGRVTGNFCPSARGQIGAAFDDVASSRGCGKTKTQLAPGKTDDGHSQFFRRRRHFNHMDALRAIAERCLERHFVVRKSVARKIQTGDRLALERFADGDDFAQLTAGQHTGNIFLAVRGGAIKGCYNSTENPASTQ